jgi:hypothetical protein
VFFLCELKILYSQYAICFVPYSKLTRTQTVKGFIVQCISCAYHCMLFLDTMHKDPCRKPCHFVVYFSNLLLRGLQTRCM